MSGKKGIEIKSAMNNLYLMPIAIHHQSLIAVIIQIIWNYYDYQRITNQCKVEPDDRIQININDEQIDWSPENIRSWMNM